MIEKQKIREADYLMKEKFSHKYNMYYINTTCSLIMPSTLFYEFVYKNISRNSWIFWKITKIWIFVIYNIILYIFIIFHRYYYYYYTVRLTCKALPKRITLMQRTTDVKYKYTICSGEPVAPCHAASRHADRHYGQSRNIKYSTFRDPGG